MHCGRQAGRSAKEGKEKDKDVHNNLQPHTLTCNPSFPLIPIPTPAAWIMSTSFAPSPIARVMGSGTTCSRTSATISAFCVGETRHAITVAHCKIMICIKIKEVSKC